MGAIIIAKRSSASELARGRAVVAAAVARVLGLALLLAAPASLAQLTHQQKVDDFRALVALYDKGYGPYDWKVSAFNSDLLDTNRWLQQVNSSHDDLEFYDICVRYVASLHDSHAEFTLPSLYEAYLPFTADLYDGRVLIDAIDRTALPVQTYPFTIGDELVSVDGRSSGAWIEALRPYAVNAQGNPISRDRIAVGTILDRYQGWYTYANLVRPGDIASVVVRRQDGSVGTYAIPWRTLGFPLDQVGPVPNPGGRFARGRPGTVGPGTRSVRGLAKSADNTWGVWTGDPPPRERPPMTPAAERLERLQEGSALQPDFDVAGSIVPFGSRFPAFNPPPGFHLRLGALQSHQFVSGTFPVGGRTFGFIRIPTFSPSSVSTALAQFQAEIIFFQQNTSGLVIDLMNNGGGSLCYANNLVQLLSPTQFAPIPFRIRATEWWFSIFENALITAQLSGAPQLTVDALGSLFDAVQAALVVNRGMTDPIPYISPAFCSASGGLLYPPATDSHGNNIAYTRPIVVLTNGFTLSAAESFSALLQDLKRATVFGVPTDGGGGNVVGYTNTTGPFSMGSARVTLSIEVRDHLISAPGLPNAPYIENIGVQPDVTADYQTTANLLTGGQPFVQGFSALIAGLAGP